MPFTFRADGKAATSRRMYVTLMVTGEPGLTVPPASLTVTPDGAETLNEIGPLAAVTVNEPVQMLVFDSAIDTVAGDSLRTGGGGGGGFGFGGAGAFGGADFAGADAGDDGLPRPGADDLAAGAEEPGDGEPGDGEPPPGGAEIGRAGSGLGRPG
jgi:hypothetical protein